MDTDGIPERTSAELDAVGYELLLRYETARRAIAMWDEERTIAGDELKKILELIDDGMYQGRKVVSVTRTRPRRFDVTAFKEDHPSIYEEYRKEPDEDEVRLNPAKNLPWLPDEWSAS